MMKQRDLALKPFLKSKLITDHYIYKSLRNKVTMQLKKAKANFYLNIITEAKGNTKLLWRSMDKLLGRGKSNCDLVHLKINGVIQNDNTEMAIHLNNYFLDSVLSLANAFPKLNCVPNSESDKSSLGLYNVDEGTVLKLISHLNNSMSKDILTLILCF